MMKKKSTFLAFCCLFAATSMAQVNPPSQTDTHIWGVIENTGIAIAPEAQWNAIAFDDPSGDYYVEWRDAATGGFLWQETQPGRDPDVAYYLDHTEMVVGYENGGDIYVDDYTYMGGAAQYSLSAQTFIDQGITPNIDMNSMGFGVITWENGGDVYMCSYDIGGVVGPVVGVNGGITPDIALMDNNDHVILTYVQGSDLFIETYDYGALTGGSLSPTSGTVVVPTSGSGFEWPRLQSNRNSLFGPADFYTVVAQDMVGGDYEVWAYFFDSPGNMINMSFVNDGVNMCSPSFPRPVVAYERDQIHVAFSQDYTCSGIPSSSAMTDVLMVQYDLNGNYFPWSTTPGPGAFQQINDWNFNFTFSATSLNTEYDGLDPIYDATFCEGIAYNDPGDLFWKSRTASNFFFRTSGTDKFTVKVDKGVTSNLITLEVATSDETLTEGDLEMTFALYDQSGRVVDVPTFEQEGMVYRIDATSLEHGIYLLHYTLNGDTKAVRIPHFTN
jgi:hypothetical protein